MDPCKSLAGVSPGQSPLQLLRSLNEGKGAKSLNEGSKIVMPFRQGPTLTTYMVDYIPPSVMPRYSGGLPCISTCFANTSGSEPRKTLQSERCDILGARVRRKFLYGRLPCDYSPFPDVAAARKVMQWKKLMETPTILPSNVDKTRRTELQMFHERCVNFRDYYVDKTDTLHPDDFFYVGKPYPIRCAADDRVFKVGTKEDVCDLPRFLGPPFRCAAMPCLKAKGAGITRPYAMPQRKVPAWPFQDEPPMVEVPCDTWPIPV